MGMGVTLSDEQLEAVSGGGCSGSRDAECPKCGSNDITTEMEHKYKCRKCGHKWNATKYMS